MKKIMKIAKATSKLWKTIKKAFATWNNAVFAIFVAIVYLNLSACGVTKAVISKPAEGTTTTVTITTNNPITTTTSPETDVNWNK